MKTKRASGEKTWSDSDDAPRLTGAFFEHAEIRDGEQLVRPARPASLPLDADVADALREAGDDWRTKANEALRAAFGKREG